MAMVILCPSDLVRGDAGCHYTLRPGDVYACVVEEESTDEAEGDGR